MEKDAVSTMDDPCCKEWIYATLMCVLIFVTFLIFVYFGFDLASLLPLIVALGVFAIIAMTNVPGILTKPNNPELRGSGMVFLFVSAISLFGAYASRDRAVAKGLLFVSLMVTIACLPFGTCALDAVSTCFFFLASFTLMCVVVKCLRG